MRLDGLTDDEGVVMDALVVAAEGFSRLLREHPDELSIFVGGIHTCQAQLAVRLARRTSPQGWPSFRQD